MSILKLLSTDPQGQRWIPTQYPHVEEQLLHVPAVFVNSPKSKIPVLVERHNPLHEYAKPVPMFQVRVKQGPKDGERILGRLGGSKRLVGLRLEPDPELAAEACRRHGERIVVSIDARDGIVAVEGWREATDEHADDLLRKLASLGVQRFVYTDIERDGKLQSPNYESIQAMIAASDAPIIAAGGVAEVSHLVRLADLGAEAAIIGLALYDGRVSLPEALAAVG